MATGINDHSPPRNYSRDYSILIRLAPNLDKRNPAVDSVLAITIRCHDLLQVMRQGLFWTTSNVVPEGGFYAPMEANPKSSYQFKRIWKLREFTNRPESECRWVGEVFLFDHSIQALGDFRLYTLRREHIFFCSCTNKSGNGVFQYSRSDPTKNINCFSDDLHPSHGSWWFWPMETILDYNALGCGEKAATERLVDVA